VKKFTNSSYEIVIFNNNDMIQQCYLPSVVELSNGTNLGHGEGLNRAIAAAQGEYILILDIDCHILDYWEEDFFSQREDVIVAKGPPEKPIRPACMFLKRSILEADNYDFRTTPNYHGVRKTPEGYDVGILAYYKMVKNGVTFKFLNSFKNRYGTHTGEEWGLEKPLFYHHWHGTSIHLPLPTGRFSGHQPPGRKGETFRTSSLELL
jgi:glycosyltransferase involved in cell wall biosynthesis